MIPPQGLGKKKNNTFPLSLINWKSIRIFFLAMIYLGMVEINFLIMVTNLLWVHLKSVVQKNHTVTAVSDIKS